MMVGQVQHGVVDPVQGAADGAVEAHPQERAVGDYQDAATTEFFGQCSGSKP